jgi:hypothetical protein
MSRILSMDFFDEQAKREFDLLCNLYMYHRSANAARAAPAGVRKVAGGPEQTSCLLTRGKR